MVGLCAYVGWCGVDTGSHVHAARNRLGAGHADRTFGGRLANERSYPGGRDSATVRRTWPAARRKSNRRAPNVC